MNFAPRARACVNVAYLFSFSATVQIIEKHRCGIQYNISDLEKKKPSSGTVVKMGVEWSNAPEIGRFSPLTHNVKYMNHFLYD